MLAPTHKIVRWPLVECPKCGCKYSVFQGGTTTDSFLPTFKKSRKWLKCIECDCEYVLICPEGIVREGDR